MYNRINIVMILSSYRYYNEIGNDNNIFVHKMRLHEILVHLRLNPNPRPA